MGNTELSDAAWDLVDHCRAALSIAELNAAFVCLGVGEYAEAIEVVLRSVGRGAAPALPPHFIDRLTSLQQVHYFDRDFAGLLAAAADRTFGVSSP